MVQRGSGRFRHVWRVPALGPAKSAAKRIAQGRRCLWRRYWIAVVLAGRNAFAHRFGEIVLAIGRRIDLGAAGLFFLHSRQDCHCCHGRRTDLPRLPGRIYLAVSHDALGGRPKWCRPRPGAKAKQP